VQRTAGRPTGGHLTLTGARRWSQPPFVVAAGVRTSSPQGDTVSWVVRRYVAARSDVTLKAKEQYEWAIPHIGAGLMPRSVAKPPRLKVGAWNAQQVARFLAAVGDHRWGIAFRLGVL
jgi:hypothetical protein